jgi:hypothetical protein
MPFDWQAELSNTVAPAPSARVLPPPMTPAAATFAQVLKAPQTDSSNENFHTPVIRGDTVSIAITQEIYEKGTDFCKRHLRGRLVLNKGDKPYLTRDLQLKLQKQWTTTQPWTMLSLGCGYYEFFFDSEAD